MSSIQFALSQRLRRLVGLVGGITLISLSQASPLNLEIPPTENAAIFTEPLDTTQQQGTVSTARSTSEEQELGRQLLRLIRQERPIIEDAEINEWLQSLANRLALHSPNRHGALHVIIENNPEINARALLGGVIIINSGLILNTQSESELAAVLAHEMAHISQRHIDRMLEEKRFDPLWAALAVLAGIAVADKSPDFAQAIVNGSSALQAHRQILFSHRAESEADRIGLRILSASGFNPIAMPSFLEKLDQGQNDIYGDIRQYLQTHPLTIDRVSDTRSRAQSLGARRGQEDPRYAFAREKIRQIMRVNHVPSLQQKPDLLETYQLALQAQLKQQFQTVLQRLPQNTGQLPPDLLRVEALIQSKNYAEAEALLKTLRQRYPNHTVVITQLAEIYTHTQCQDAAIALLTQAAANQNETSNLEFFETAQRVAQQAGYPAEARLFSAERSIRLGEYAHAKANLEAALKQTDLAPPVAAQMRNRLLSIATMLRSQKQLGLN